MESSIAICEMPNCKKNAIKGFTLCVSCYDIGIVVINARAAYEKLILEFEDAFVTAAAEAKAASEIAIQVNRLAAFIENATGSYVERAQGSYVERAQELRVISID